MASTAKFLSPPPLFLHRYPHSTTSRRLLFFLLSHRRLELRCSAAAAKRTGKRRYPSEKKKLQKLKDKLISETEIKNKFQGIWRLSKLGVPAKIDPGKDFFGISQPLLEAIAKVLEFPVPSMLPQEAFSVIRKSFDARKILKEPEFVYVVDMDVEKLLELEPRTWDFISRLEPELGAVEYIPYQKSPGDLISILQGSKQKLDGLETKIDIDSNIHIKGPVRFAEPKKPKIAVIGSGPSGLFASLVLGELGADVTLIERGQPVEQRGRDIGALVARKILQSESNFCFGEGGAGTWSDGKLVTRIGRNSDSVQTVMRTLIRFGAPPNIIIDGKPHLGTDRLVPLLRKFRQHLQNLGVNIKFGTRLNNLIVKNGQILGIEVSDARSSSNLDIEKILSDAVVLAVGHSARDVYKMLFRHNADLAPKDFSINV